MSIVAKINTTEYASCVRANFSMSPAYCHASILATTFVSPSAVPCVVFVIVIVLYAHHFNCSLLVSCVFTRSCLSSVCIVSIIPPKVSTYWRDVCGDFHGISTVRPWELFWTVKEAPWKYLLPWGLHGTSIGLTSMRCPWDFRWTSMKRHRFAGDVYGTSMGRPWDFDRTSVGPPWTFCLFVVP